MSKHDGDDNLKRRTPSQAEGEEETVDAALNPEKRDTPDTEPLLETPSQAEGSREVVEEQLEEENH